MQKIIRLFYGLNVIVKVVNFLKLQRLSGMKNQSILTIINESSLLYIPYHIF